MKIDGSLDVTQTDAETGWSFVALNETKTWKEDDPELGKAYLVEENKAVANDGGMQVELVKIEAGTTLKAGRCYFVMNTMPTERGDINNDGRISIADLNSAHRNPERTRHRHHWQS